MGHLPGRRAKGEPLSTALLAEAARTSPSAARRALYGLEKKAVVVRWKVGRPRGWLLKPKKGLIGQLEIFDVNLLGPERA